MAYGSWAGSRTSSCGPPGTNRYSTKDVLWTALCMFLAVQAVYSGRLDLSEELAKYSETIESLASSPPLVPPAVLS